MNRFYIFNENRDFGYCGMPTYIGPFYSEEEAEEFCYKMNKASLEKSMRDAMHEFIEENKELTNGLSDFDILDIMWDAGINDEAWAASYYPSYSWGWEKDLESIDENNDDNFLWVYIETYGSYSNDILVKDEDIDSPRATSVTKHFSTYVT